MRKIIYSLLIVFTSSVFAQLKEVSLDNNILLQKNKIKTTINKAISTVDTLELPFFDDFSQKSIFPSSNFWIDSNVFLNNSFPDTPIFRGVATFDCLNKYGEIYSNANNFSFIADTLVSKPINLNYPPNKNIVISFFVQPQGLAYDPPEERDSLVLKIKAPGTKWKSIWHMEGSRVKPFKQILIPITDTMFLKKGFQMQFLNYASVSSDNRSSNGDYWNLDLVRIDTARTINDTVINDVGFVTTPKSYLKDYYAIPCSHMSSSFDAKENIQSYRNYGDSTIGFDRRLYSYSINNIKDTFNIGGTTDLNPHTFYSHSFIYNSPIFRYNYFLGLDSIEFLIKSVLHLNSSISNEYRHNDTAYFVQKFYNYYALDDGVPEAGIGIDGLESEGAKLAVKFYTIKPDTLRSIRIWFNRTNNESNKDIAFDLLVWNNDDGKPGDIIYEEDELLTKYSNGLDNYVDYMLKTPFLLSDTFFVGFRQNHEIYMNLGFDKSYDNSSRTFYSISSWNQSENKGTIMIRPVFGKKFRSDINAYLSTNSISIYPNPANNFININTKENFTLTIYNQTGQLLNTYKNKRIINVSYLIDGLYFIKITTNKTSVTKKIIIKK